MSDMELALALTLLAIAGGAVLGTLMFFLVGCTRPQGCAFHGYRRYRR